MYLSIASFISTSFNKAIHKGSGLLLLLGLLSFNTNAALMETDYLAAGDGLLTFDSVTNFAWLDLSASASRSYSDVSSQLAAGGEFEGFRYASGQEVYELYRNNIAMTPFVVNPSGYFAQYNHNNSFVNAINSLLGKSSGSFAGFVADVSTDITMQALAYVQHGARSCGGYRNSFSCSYHNDQIRGLYTNTDKDNPGNHFLLRAPSPVPVPTAAWLFGTALLGFVGLSRKTSV